MGKAVWAVPPCQIPRSRPGIASKLRLCYTHGGRNVSAGDFQDGDASLMKRDADRSALWTVINLVNDRLLVTP